MRLASVAVLRRGSLYLRLGRHREGRRRARHGRLAGLGVAATRLRALQASSHGASRLERWSGRGTPQGVSGKEPRHSVVGGACAEAPPVFPEVPLVSMQSLRFSASPAVADAPYPADCAALCVSSKVRSTGAWLAPQSAARMQVRWQRSAEGGAAAAAAAVAAPSTRHHGPRGRPETFSPTEARVDKSGPRPSLAPVASRRRLRMRGTVDKRTIAAAGADVGRTASPSSLMVNVAHFRMALFGVEAPRRSATSAHVDLVHGLSGRGGGPVGVGNRCVPAPRSARSLAVVGGPHLGSVGGRSFVDALAGGYGQEMTTPDNP